MSLHLRQTTAVAAALAIAAGAASSAEARCVTNGTTTTCDTSPPNPETAPVTNVNVRVLSGAAVSASGLAAVNVLPNGSLVTEAGSQITSGGDVVILGQNATGAVAGAIRANSDQTQGVRLDTGTTFTVSQGGLVEATGGVGTGILNPRNVAINTTAGAKVTINVDGTVRSTAAEAPAIAGFSSGVAAGSINFGASTINVGTTGLVEATGILSPAIYAGGGTVINVAGTVRSTGSAFNDRSNAILAGGNLTVNVAQTGQVVSTQSTAILGAASARVNVTIAGTVTGPTGGYAIYLQGDSKVTLLPRAVVNGRIIAPNLVLSAAQGTSGTYDFGAAPPIVASLFKEGAGTWTLTGQQDRNFGILVSAGTLVENAAFPSTSFRVDTGGRLEGNGSLAYLEVAGTVAPGVGNAIGTLNVNGASFAPDPNLKVVVFDSGGVYEVNANAAGQSDRIATTRGALIESGATVRVLAENGNYAPSTQYTILTTGTGITGTFSGVTSNLAFLTPTLTYTATDVRLLLIRNDLHFADAAQTANQKATGQALERLGVSNPIFLAIVGQSAAGARGAFDALSGEIYPSLVSYLTQESRLARRGLLDATADAPEGVAVWGDASRTWTRHDAEPVAGTASGRGRAEGIEGGLTFRRGGFVAAVGAGGYDQDYRLADRGSRATVKTTFIGGDIGYAAGPFKLAAGYGYGSHDVRTRRDIAFAILGPTGAKADGHTSQVFGDASYGFSAGALKGAVFGGYAHVSTDIDAFQEAPNTARLSVAAERMRTGFLRGGLRLGLDLPASGSVTIAPRASIAYVSTSGDRRGIAAMTFQGQTTPFVVTGAPLPRSAVEARAGLDFVGEAVRIGLSYDGLIASRWEDHGARLTGSFSF